MGRGFHEFPDVVKQVPFLGVPAEPSFLIPAPYGLLFEGFPELRGGYYHFGGGEH